METVAVVAVVAQQVHLVMLSPPPLLPRLHQEAASMEAAAIPGRNLNELHIIIIIEMGGVNRGAASKN